MMNSKRGSTNRSLLFVISLSISTVANAAGSMLSVTCEGSDAGAEVLINGKFRGECPIDLQVPAGTLKLLVRKKMGDQGERRFEREIPMGDGAVKVEAQLQMFNKNLLKALKNAEAGDVNSMRLLAVVHQWGKNGLRRDPEQAFFWWHKTAKAGAVDAMFEVGRMYKSGEGVEANAEQADQWFRWALELCRKGVENGDSRAMIDLGSAYMHGYGVPEDSAEALMWYHKARDKGNHDADLLLQLYE